MNMAILKLNGAAAQRAGIRSNGWLCGSLCSIMMCTFMNNSTHGGLLCEPTLLSTTS